MSEPVAKLPEPGGPFPVGTLSLHLVDPAREEAYTVAPDDRREMVVELWYPAAPAPDAKTAPWLGQASRFTQSHDAVLVLVGSAAQRRCPMVGKEASFQILGFVRALETGARGNED